MNYFELFSLPQAPAVDRSMLAKRYVELQKANHPDFYTQATEAEKEQALEKSASINKAFKIFQDKERTIEYFLETIGLIEADEKYKLPQDFLMEMMDINESLTEGEPGESEKNIHEYEKLLEVQARPILQNYDPAKTTNAELSALKEYYYKKKYLKRILDRLAD